MLSAQAVSEPRHQRIVDEGMAIVIGWRERSERKIMRRDLELRSVYVLR